jgi:hypothetical protein
MKPLTRILALSVTTLAFAGTVHAQDGQPSKGAEVKTVYEGLDAQGRVVKVTVTSPSGTPAIAVAAPSSPALHWTAHIGAGNAASLPH